MTVPATVTRVDTRLPTRSAGFRRVRRSRVHACRHAADNLLWSAQGLGDSGTACPVAPPAANNVTQIGGFGFTWNRANEVTADTLGTTFAYDAHGWRVKQHVTAGGTHTRYFVYDAGHRLIERLDNGTATDFVYVGSKPIARRTGSTTTYVHGDEQNSPLFETSSAGAITRQPVYLGYGESDTVGIAEIPGYAGSAPDKETGINYMGARYYYAYVGRFLSPDPAELDPTTHIGLNRYAYANDNPVRFTDPDGRQTEGPNGYGFYGQQETWTDTFLGGMVAHTFGDPIAVFRPDHLNPINGKVLTPGEVQDAKFAAAATLIPLSRVDQAGATATKAIVEKAEQLVSKAGKNSVTVKETLILPRCQSRVTSYRA